MEYKLLQGNVHVDVKDIAYHSKKAGLGTLFVCIEGADHDGHQFAKEAVEKGAAVIICSKPLSFTDDTTVILVSNCRKALSQVGAAFYGFPSRQLRLIGVTGTKGKTTVTYMLREIFRHQGEICGLIGTVEIDTGKRRIQSDHTTPESLEIHQMLREMVEAGCTTAILEVSSQALKQERVYGLEFEISVLTNVEEDHIGKNEHQSFDEYVRCKAKLFQHCKKAVINYDDSNKERILNACLCNEVLTYGRNKAADIYVSDFDHVRIPGKLGVEFETKGRYNIKLVVSGPGQFTVYNGLAAVLTAKSLGIDDESVQKAMKTFSVPGRQEIFPLAFDRLILVDYAHNGTALTALLKGLAAYHPTRITCVFGCGGQRDRNRRFHMGEAAAKYADFSVITADNPRNESLDSIIGDIIEKMRCLLASYCVIPDRRQAITWAVENCLPGEIVVIAGKGHEQYQIIGNQRLHFDDREEVRTSIEKVKHEQDYN